MDALQVVSILIEVLIVAVALSIGTVKGKVYGYGFALTFAVYAYYDLVNALSLTVSPGLLPLLFFMATVSALAAMWALYKKP